MNAHKKELKLVEVHGQKLTVTSLVVAKEFGRTHGNVIKSIEKLKGRIQLDSTPYLDIQGKTQKMYVLDERSFLIAMPFIGGKKSEDGQVLLVDEFLRIRKLLNEPNRKEALQYKRDTHTPMMEMLRFGREIDGKETETHHFQNENKFCNRALTGQWVPCKEESLDVYDARLLEAIRKHNTLLISRYPIEKDRKDFLDQFVTNYRAKYPRFQQVVSMK